MAHLLLTGIKPLPPSPVTHLSLDVYCMQSNDTMIVTDKSDADSELEAQAEQDAEQAEARETFGLSDDAFQTLMHDAVRTHPLATQYPTLFDAAPKAWTAWRRRFRGNPVVWKRLFDQRRVIKEFIEAVPVLDAVQSIVTSTDSAEAAAPPFTIIDLCSGKGYLSMMLSELLPPERVKRLVLMDKAWPQHGMEPAPHHISWQHIYGRIPNTNKETTYSDTWPIPLQTHKVDLKHGNQRRRLAAHYLSNPETEPVLILGIHLCGTLSIHAVRFFVEHEAVHFMALKPCCLPGMVHAKRHEQFQVGEYSFPAEGVCVPGKWNKNTWRGGPKRAERAIVFDSWTRHLYQAAAQQQQQSLHARLVCIPVQQEGGHQNDFVLAQRPPATDNLWNRLPEQKKQTQQRQQQQQQE